ncbi:hypothetical protein HHL17_26570 [Chitinophaga sp. G-6-1-13]|uniref:Uncharacterized protein n=1 Tax=Chitinophaga fulva TaxID=2728842 RepID=A0A848GVS7_9BACT|nr:hypothetical protein [Chitinophaga fulva]NML40790.1 hypothetical protein [Chitinophaga fulva]
MNKEQFSIGDVVDCPLHEDASVMFVRSINAEKDELLLADAPEGGNTIWMHFKDVAGVPLTPRVLQLAGFKPIAGKKGLYGSGNGLRLQRLGNGYYVEDVYDEQSEPLVMESLHELQHYYSLLLEQPLRINGIHRPMPLAELCPDHTATHYYWFTYQRSDGHFIEDVTSQHPLSTVSALRLLEDSGIVLFNWQTISYDQYLSFDKPWTVQ